MILFSFIAIAIVYYLIQKDQIKRNEKRVHFKIRQEEKLAQLLKNAKEDDQRKQQNNNL